MVKITHKINFEDDIRDASESLIKVTRKGEDTVFRLVGPKGSIDACLRKIENTKIRTQVRIQLLEGINADTEIKTNHPTVQTVSAGRLLAFYSRAERRVYARNSETPSSFPYQKGKSLEQNPEVTDSDVPSFGFLRKDRPHGSQHNYNI